MPTSMFISLLVFTLACLGYAIVGDRIARRDDWLARVMGDLAPAATTFFGALVMSYLFSVLVGANPKPYYHLRMMWGAALPTLVVVLFPRRVEPIVSGLLLAALALLLVADLVYYRFFGGLLPLLAAGGAGMLGDVTDSIAEVMRDADLFFALPVLGALVIAARCPRPRTPYALPFLPRVTTKHVVIAAALGCMIALASDTGRWMGRSRSWRVLSGLHMVGWGGIIDAHVREIARVTRERSADELSPGEVEEVVEFFTEKVKAREDYPGFGVWRGKSVLLLQIEGFQEFATSITVEGEPAMPFFQSLIARGLYHDNVYDLTGESLTSDCGYMVLNSLHALKQGAVAFRRPGNTFTTIAHALQASGYETISAHGYRKGMWNRAILHPRYGFQRSYFREELGDDPRIGWGLSDEGFFAKMVPILKEAKRPSFAFLISLTSHHPFRYIPAERRKLKLSNRTAFAGYMHSMRYVDEALGQLFAQLEEAGLLEDTVVVIYGDHDSRLELDAETTAVADDHTSLPEEELEFLKARGFPTDKIPLLIVPPKSAPLPPRVISTLGGQVDIAPTILHYLGVEAPASFVGAPLVPERPGHAYRVDGAAAEPELLMGGRDNPTQCLKRPFGPALPTARCTELRTRAEREGTLSERATLHDLAKVINARVDPAALRAARLATEEPRPPASEDAGVALPVDGGAAADP